MAYNPNVPAPTNRVQDDLAAMRENFQHLNSSRIVEMGSNSNGYYVRWENGLQVCWRTEFPISFSASNQTNATWVYPAAFIAQPFRTAMSEGGVIEYTMEFIMTNGLVNTLFYAKIGSAQTATRHVTLFALGRWK